MSLPLSLPLFSPLNRSQCLKLIIAIVFDSSFRTPFVPSLYFVQSTSSYINVDLDSEARVLLRRKMDLDWDQPSTCATILVLLVAVLLSVGTCDFHLHKSFQNLKKSRKSQYLKWNQQGIRKQRLISNHLSTQAQQKA